MSKVVVVYDPETRTVVQWRRLLPDVAHCSSREFVESQRDALDPIAPRLRHYLGALAVLGTTVVLSSLLLHFRLLRYSVISLFTGSPVTAHGTVPTTGPAGWIWTAVIILVVVLSVKSLLTPGRIAREAMREEQKYRAGAEYWGWIDRLRSCALFGATHFLNLIVPLCVLPGLASAGGWFMWQYLRTYRREQSRAKALQEAAALHTAYNRIIIGVLCGGLALVAVVTALGSVRL